ncbi:MAG TPA: hypothetical protein VM487_00835 [Phycisphaerae bacterium]|nr:hypothetical protein [Phycisphaerae bacterium]
MLKWTPLAAASVSAWTLLAWKSGEIETAGSAVWMLRFTMLIVTYGAVFLLDDASRSMSEPAPISLQARVGLRCILMAALGLLAMIPVVVTVSAKVDLGGDWRGLAVEFTVVVLLAISCSLVLQRTRGISEPGQFAGLAPILIFVAAELTGGRWPLLPTPGPLWADAHARWLAIGLVAAVVVVWQLRDPAAPSLARSLRLTR